jgi:hypothetical protein
MIKSCTCAKCVEACRRMPGWMTVEEAKKAMGAGMGTRLMRDWLDPSTELGNEERIYVLCPAAEGREGGDAADVDEMFPDNLLMALLGCAAPVAQPCVMLTREGRCELHTSGFKPRQCREALVCDNRNGADKYEMAKEWDTPEGRNLVERWSELIRGV